MIVPGLAFLMSQECETRLEALPEQHVLTGFIYHSDLEADLYAEIFNISEILIQTGIRRQNSISKITECGNHTCKRLVRIRKWVSVALSIVQQ